MGKRTELEDELAYQLDLAGIEYEREFKAIENRRFKWDFFIEKQTPNSRDILIEVQGGIWVKGGHSTGTGITRDAEKLNLATLAGYSSLVVTKEHIKSGQALKWIQEAIG
jgi:hypothetical protein